MNKELRGAVDKLRLDIDLTQGQLSSSERSKLQEGKWVDLSWFLVEYWSLTEIEVVRVEGWAYVYIVMTVGVLFHLIWSGALESYEVFLLYFTLTMP